MGYEYIISLDFAVGNALCGVPNSLRNGTEAVPYTCKMG